MSDVDVCLSCDLGEDNMDMKAMHGFCNTCLDSGRAALYQIGLLDIDYETAELGWQKWCGERKLPIQKLENAYPNVYDMIAMMKALTVMEYGPEYLDPGTKDS